MECVFPSFIFFLSFCAPVVSKSISSQSLSHNSDTIKVQNWNLSEID